MVRSISLAWMPTGRGVDKYPGNSAGAKYGTDYCYVQCPHDLKYVNGEVKCEEWNQGRGF